MRDFKGGGGMKRQRGRNRNSGGGGLGGGNSPKQNANRAFESNGPENLKVRGHAQHVYDKYQQLARDAASASDRVLAENFLQHAEHYYRVLRALQPQRPASDFVSRDPFASGYDAEIDEDGEYRAEAEVEGPAAAGGGEERGEGVNGQGGDRYEQGPRRFDRDREGQGGRDRQERDRGEYRGDRQDREYRNDRPGGERPERDYRDPPRGEQPRGEQPRGEQQRGEQQRAEPPRGDRPEQRPRDDRYPPRGDNREVRREEPRDRYEGEPRQNGESRGERDARRREREYGGRGERPSGRYGVPDENTPPREPAPAAAEARPSAPTSEDGPMLRSQDGGVFEAPAFLAAAAPAPAPTLTAEADEAPAPKKRAPRRRKAADEGAAQAEEA